MRVLLADPAAFTPQYDHELAAALARAGADVELVTSRFRFGEAPAPDGYRRRELFYPLIVAPLPALAAAAAGQGARAPARDGAGSRAQSADVVHFQWLAAAAARRAAAAAPRARRSSPRTTCCRGGRPRKRELWRRAARRASTAVVVHSERGRGTLADLGVPADRVRVIPHPVFRSDPPRADDGRTLLALGVIRPYKGLGDAIEAARRARRTRACSSRATRSSRSTPTARAAGDRAEWRLGYLPDAELDRALGEATVALFPYRAELDQSGALLRALGAGVPAVVYDVGGLAEPVERFGAGRVVPAGDVEALTRAAGDLLGDPEALEAARAGARAARDALTWDASATAHLELYRSLTSSS